MDMKKVLQELFGCPYRSNGTKMHLDAALFNIHEENLKPKYKRF